jgi:uncharacterized protein (DUF362 family)
MKDKKNKISRRKFIKLVGGGAAGITAVSCIPHVGGNWESCEVEDPGEIPTPLSNRVVEVYAENSVVEEDGIIVGEVVTQMFSAGLLALTDAATLEEAWQMVLPGRLAGERIALKVNALNPDVPTSPEICSAIVDSLQNDLQVEAGDILIWDRTTRELETVELDKLNAPSLGTVYSAKVEKETVEPGYEAEPVCLTGRKIYLSRMLTREIDHMINVAVMKNHFAAKFTGCMKNNYGVFSMPHEFHEGSDDHVANLNVMPEITRVSRLFMIDALFGVCVGDTDKPADCAPRRILLSFDPVAIDQRGLEIRDEIRWEKYSADPGEQPGYIQKAADMGLGSMEYDLVTIEL